MRQRRKFFLICCLIGLSESFSLEALVETLQSILLKPDPPKGTPFPAIPGPNKDDRVCIVGAGPPGVHMGMRLKQLGHDNVTIFEKSNKVGGKSYDVRILTSRHTMLVCFKCNIAYMV